MRYFILLCAMLIFCTCQMERESKVNPLEVKAFGTKGIHAIIEIPAGTNQKIEFDYTSKSFKVDQIDGKDRVIDFLPYPGNYGFVPGTKMDEKKGGDGDALDILVLSESLPTGTSIEVIPIAALELIDKGELDTKLIAVPVDSTQRIIQATNFEDFLIEYNIAQTIIKDWFLNYKGLGVVEMKGWRDEVFARSEVEKWMENEELGMEN